MQKCSFKVKIQTRREASNKLVCPKTAETVKLKVNLTEHADVTSNVFQI